MWYDGLCFKIFSDKIWIISDLMLSTAAEETFKTLSFFKHAAS